MICGIRKTTFVFRRTLLLMLIGAGVAFVVLLYYPAVRRTSTRVGAVDFLDESLSKTLSQTDVLVWAKVAEIHVKELKLGPKERLFDIGYPVEFTATLNITDSYPAIAGSTLIVTGRSYQNLTLKTPAEGIIALKQTSTGGLTPAVFPFAAHGFYPIQDGKALYVPNMGRGLPSTLVWRCLRDMLDAVRGRAGTIPEEASGRWIEQLASGEIDAATVARTYFTIAKTESPPAIVQQQAENALTHIASGSIAEATASLDFFNTFIQANLPPQTLMNCIERVYTLQPQGETPAYLERGAPFWEFLSRAMPALIRVGDKDAVARMYGLFVRDTRQFAPKFPDIEDFSDDPDRLHLSTSMLRLVLKVPGPERRERVLYLLNTYEDIPGPRGSRKLDYFGSLHVPLGVLKDTPGDDVAQLLSEMVNGPTKFRLVRSSEDIAAVKTVVQIRTQSQKKPD